MELQLALISHELRGTEIHQRQKDGYVNATAMCKAAGKFFAHYNALQTTKDFLGELSAVIGIPITDLVLTIQGGRPELQGTWIHPDAAVHLAQWCSPRVAVAVSQWVREWATKKEKQAALPYHVQRYVANQRSVPPTHFSMLNEMIFSLIGPLEADGYTMPEEMVPDISEGKMFSVLLREKGVRVEDFPTYPHRYADGRVYQARLYPIAWLAEFKTHFYEVWLPRRAMAYFQERDPKALPYLPKLLPAAAPKPVGIKSAFSVMKQAAKGTPPPPPLPPPSAQPSLF